MNPIVKEAIERCRTAGLRHTKALDEPVIMLLESLRPIQAPCPVHQPEDELEFFGVCPKCA